MLVKWFISGNVYPEGKWYKFGADVTLTLPADFVDGISNSDVIDKEEDIMGLPIKKMSQMVIDDHLDFTAHLYSKTLLDLRNQVFGTRSRVKYQLENLLDAIGRVDEGIEFEDTYEGLAL